MKQKERYFLAIIPPSPVYEQAMDIKHYFKDQYNCKASLRSPAHITLQMPFQFSESKEAELIHQLQLFASGQQAFSLHLNGFNCFEPRVIYIDVIKSKELQSMQKALAKYLKSHLGIFNADYKNRGFNPHMTVAFRDLRKPLFYQAWSEFQDKPFEGKFEVQGFWLLKHDGQMWQPQREISWAQ